MLKATIIRVELDDGADLRGALAAILGVNGSTVAPKQIPIATPARKIPEDHPWVERNGAIAIHAADRKRGPAKTVKRTMRSTATSATNRSARKEMRMPDRIAAYRAELERLHGPAYAQRVTLKYSQQGISIDPGDGKPACRYRWSEFMEMLEALRKRPAKGEKAEKAEKAEA